MQLSRPSRFIAALVTVIGILYMQFALASYTCPGMVLGDTNDMAAMSGCTGMDAEQPTLCHAHDHVGKQSLDKPELPKVQSFLAIGLALRIIPIDIAYRHRPLATPPQTTHLKHAIAPPLSIRNCCFRI